MQTTIRRIFTLLLILVTTFLNACGGGSADPSGTKDRQSYDLGGTPVKYAGLTQPAKLTPHNAYNFLEIAFLFAGVVSGDEVCLSGGISNLQGGLDANGNGSLLLEYDNCLSDGVTIDGRMEVQFSDDGAQLRMFFNALSFTDNTGVTIRFGGRVSSEAPLDCSGSSETYDVVASVVGADTYYWAQDLRLARSVSCRSDSPETMMGRLYVSDYGYVDISTLAPYAYSSNPLDDTLYFPDRAGHVRLSGANGTSADYQVNIEKVYKNSVINVKLPWVQFGVDVDGDSQPDNSTRLTVSQFEAGGAENLNDSDGDGLIDSWEALFGLDPANPGDALLDKDGDGYSNLDEYLL